MMMSHKTMLLFQKIKKKDDLGTLVINIKRLAEETAVTAKRHKVVETTHRDMLANVINIGKGDIVDFSLSNKTVRMAGTVTVRKDAAKIMEDFNKLLVEDLGGKECMIIYFDGKALPHFHDKVKSIKKRTRMGCFYVTAMLS